jgi:hypothetical protein
MRWGAHVSGPRTACALAFALALLAGVARAEVGGAVTVSARVGRTARLSVVAVERAGRVRLEARVARGGRRGAGVAVSVRGARSAAVGPAPLVAEVAAPAGASLVVTVFPDGSPPTVSIAN